MPDDSIFGAETIVRHFSSNATGVYSLLLFLSHPFQSAPPTSSSSRASTLALNPVLRQPTLLASLRDSFAEAKDLRVEEEKRLLKVHASHRPFSVARLFHFLQVG